MEPFFGCLAVAIVAVVFGLPIAGFVLALQARRSSRELAARLAELERRLTTAPPAAETVARSAAAPPPAEAAAPVRPPPAVVAPPGWPLTEPLGRPVAAPEPATPSLPPFASYAPAPPIDPTPAVTVADAPVQKAGPGLEERLGARLPVWLGGIALALAGAFLVKYTFDRGLLSPTVRVALGLVFGVALLGVGEWMRGRSPRIGQALSAAGVADLYAALFAGVQLYRLIPPLVGFGLMAANTAVAVLLSLRQGPMIALLGLVGGFLTPALVQGEDRDLRGVLAYLLLLDVGLVLVTRRRRWPVLAFGALGGSLLWVLGWVASGDRSGDAAWLGVFLLAAVAVFAAAALRARRDAEGTPFETSPALAWVTACAGLATMAILMGATGYGALEWGLFGLLIAGCLALARMRESEFFALAPVAALTALVQLVAWGGRLADGDEPRFLLTAALAGLLIAGGSYVALFGAATPATWSALSAAALLAFPLVGWAFTEAEIDLPWGALSVALGALAIAAAVPIARRRATLAGGDRALAAFAVAATLFASLAVPLELRREWLSVAWALEVPALVWLARRLRVPALDVLALVLAGAAAARLLLNPAVLSYPTGDLPVWNWLLWGYGAPLAAFALGARLARRGSGDERVAAPLEWGAVAFAFALVTLQLVQYFHLGDLRGLLRDRTLLEWSAQAIAWLGLGLLLLALARRENRAAWSWGGRIVIALAAIQTVVIHCGLENPRWESNPVGATPVLNLLLLAYAAPLLLLLVAARGVEKAGGRKLPMAARATALLLGFAWVTLQVRQFFHGSELSGEEARGAEAFSYSAAWALLGTGLLIGGIVGRSRWLRLAALLVMLAAVVKVFLVDTARLADLYRVFSFLGLGASLLLLAWLYQRFVFRDRGDGGGGNAAALVVLCALLAGPASGLELTGRTIDVPRPGRVSVDLDAAALAALGDGGGVEIFDPSGERLPAERVLLVDDAPCRDVPIESVARADGGWTIGVDLGSAPEAHAALRFELDEAVLAAGVTLEATTDGRSWRPLASADLFRLGDDSGLARTRLEYPPTRDSRLRLNWPAEAGYPRVRGVAVCAPEEPRPVPVLEIVGSASGRVGDDARWRFALPGRAARVRALRLDRLPGAAPKPLAWRLDFAQDGRWHELGAGEWRAGETSLRIPLGDAQFPGEALRLHLWGGVAVPLSAAWELAPQRVRFDAAHAGAYRLRLPAAPATVPLAPQEAQEAVRVELGAASAEAAPRPGGDLLGGEIRDDGWRRRGRIGGRDEPAAGAPVFVYVPADPEGREVEPSRWRLARGTRLVPHRVVRDAEPEVVGLVADASPRSLGDGRSGIDLAHPAAGGERVLRVAAKPGSAPFRRRVELTGVTGEAVGAPRGTVAGAVWECGERPPRRCELELVPAGGWPREARLEIDDGDDRPLGELDFEVESARARLVFLWPGGEVELAEAGAESPSPRYDLARLDAALALHRAVEAGPVVWTDEGAGGSAARRWLLIGAVGLVALALVALLARLLPRS